MPNSLGIAAVAIALSGTTGCAHLVPDGSAPATPLHEIATSQSPARQVAPFYWASSETVRIHLDSNTVYRILVTRSLGASGGGQIIFWPADSAGPTTPFQYQRLLQSFPYGDRGTAYLYTAPRSEDYLFLPGADLQLSVAALHTSWASRAPTSSR